MFEYIKRKLGINDLLIEIGRTVQHSFAARNSSERLERVWKMDLERMWMESREASYPPSAPEPSQPFFEGKGGLTIKRVGNVINFSVNEKPFSVCMERIGGPSWIETDVVKIEEANQDRLILTYADGSVGSHPQLNMLTYTTVNQPALNNNVAPGSRPDTYNPTVEQIARTCHVVNRAYCQAIGDTSQPTWEEAPDWQRESAINGVLFHLENDVTPEQSHENWLQQKRIEGWVWGDVKNPELKQHPCMVPYSELPQEQKVKDYLFKAVVDSTKKASA